MLFPTTNSRDEPPGRHHSGDRPSWRSRAITTPTTRLDIAAVTSVAGGGSSAAFRALVESFDLADGLVMDNIIECPKHNGRFDYTTGAAKGAPVCINLKTYPVKVEAGKVFIDIG